MRTPFLAAAALTSLLALGALTPGRAVAEPGGFHINVTPFAGHYVWAKDVNLANKPVVGGRLGLGFGRRVGIEGYVSWMSTRTEYGTGDSLWFYNASQTPSTEQSVQGYGLDLTLNVFPSSGFNPYILAGWHEEQVESDAGSARSYLNGPEVGGGVKIGLGRKVAVRLEARDQIWQFNPPVPDPPGDKSIHNFLYSGGLMVTLGGSPHDGDLDADGVKDSDDTCPGTPTGALVDASGCPIDSDGDLVADGIDQCPNTPAGATVDARGCPTDADADGVWDGIDQCPSTPAGAKVDARGCPVDSDGDGVSDDLDQCPNTPAGTKVDAKGCATDADGDGVTDDKDLCPNTPAGARVDAAGCPIELSEREIELLDKGKITTRDIHFETAKWDILPESRPVLDDIGKTLIQWPQLRIEVGGHCDARGSDAYNLDLSQKRAGAVLDYLLQNFPQISRDQYTAKGYGERVPVASNKTVEGMAQNRRVEFKVLNTEELTKERERRRVLQKGE